MTQKRRTSPKPIASDGLIARDNGVWAKEKLGFLDTYLPPALTATRTMRQRYFVDLFAGPGRNVDTSTKDRPEFEGGSIRALKMTDGRPKPSTFTHLVAVNLDRDDHAALDARVDLLIASQNSRVPADHVKLICGDANAHAQYIMRTIDRRAYVVVFADPESPSQLPFSTIEAVRAQKHTSVDLYVLYPSEMALRRLLGAPEVNANVLSRFYGDEVWRPLANKKLTSAQMPQLMRSLEGHYIEKLQALGWAHTRVVCSVARTGNAFLYDMILATNHPAGARIGRWAAGKNSGRQQLGFDLGDA